MVQEQTLMLYNNLAITMPRSYCTSPCPVRTLQPSGRITSSWQSAFPSLQVWLSSERVNVLRKQCEPDAPLEGPYDFPCSHLSIPPHVRSVPGLPCTPASPGITRRIFFSVRLCRMATVFVWNCTSASHSQGLRISVSPLPSSVTMGVWVQSEPRPRGAQLSPAPAQLQSLVPASTP